MPNLDNRIPAPEDVQFVGPSIWPKTISILRASDRWIVRTWPEIVYLQALRRLEARTGIKTTTIRVSVSRKINDKGKKTVRVATWRHVVVQGDRAGDVRLFLEELRRAFVEGLPDRALFGQAVELKFYELLNSTNERVAFISGPWL